MNTELARAASRIVRYLVLGDEKSEGEKAPAIEFLLPACQQVPRYRRCLPGREV